MTSERDWPFPGCVLCESPISRRLSRRVSSCPPDGVWNAARDGERSGLGFGVFPWHVGTLAETVAAVCGLIEAGRPTYFITANTHYMMVTETNPDLNAINARAAFIVADGTPPIWASRWLGSPLSERVAGSDLIFALSAKLLGRDIAYFSLGDPKESPRKRHNGLASATPRFRSLAECPPFRELTAEEQEALEARIRSARPDILFVAFGQPKGERWINQHFEKLGVPVSVQVGALPRVRRGTRSAEPRVGCRKPV